MRSPRIAAIAVAALALVACEIEEAEPARPERSSDFAEVKEPAPVEIVVPTPTTLPELPPPTPDTVNDPDLTDDEFNLMIMRLTMDDIGVPWLLSDADLLDFSKAACGLARLSNTSDEFILLILESLDGTNSDESMAFSQIGVVIGVTCPRQGERLGFL